MSSISLLITFNFSSVRDLLHQFIVITDSLIKVTHLDQVKSVAIHETQLTVTRLSALYNLLSVYTSDALVNFVKLKFNTFT